MKRHSIFQFAVVAVLIASFAVACTNIKKLYHEGETVQKSFYGQLPLVRKLNLMIVPVEIGGESYQFLFDTGAPTVISNEVFKKLNKPALGKRRAGDSQGNSDQLKFVVIDTMNIAGVTFTNTASLIADLQAAVEIKCLGIDGILGANLMKLAYWKMDPKSDSLSFSSSLKQLTTGLHDSISIPFRTASSFKPIISLNLDNKPVSDFLFDTGAGDYISMGTDLMKKENVFALYSGLGSTGLYGAVMDTLRIGKTTLGFDTLSQKCLATYKTGKATRILGMGFMKQFTIILNWQQQSIDLYQTELKRQSSKMFDVLPRWKNGQMIVGTMRVDSPNVPGDLQIGDTIVEINSESFAGKGVDAYCDLIIEGRTQEKDTLVLQMKNGKTYSFLRNSFSASNPGF